MEQVIEFMRGLFEDMADAELWYITGIENFKEVNEDGTIYAQLEDGSMYEKQDNIYIYQTTGYMVDDFSGTIIKPITNTVALSIHFEC